MISPHLPPPSHHPLSLSLLAPPLARLPVSSHKHTVPIPVPKSQPNPLPQPLHTRPPATTRLPLPQNPSLPSTRALPLRRCRRLAPARIARCPAAATPETLAHSLPPSLFTLSSDPRWLRGNWIDSRRSGKVSPPDLRSSPRPAGRGRSDLPRPWTWDRSVWLAGARHPI